MKTGRLPDMLRLELGQTDRPLGVQIRDTLDRFFQQADVDLCTLKPSDSDRTYFYQCDPYLVLPQDRTAPRDGSRPISSPNRLASAASTSAGQLATLFRRPRCNAS